MQMSVYVLVMFWLCSSPLMMDFDKYGFHPTQQDTDVFTGQTQIT